MSCPSVIGGIISELNGGSFSQGAIIAAGAAAASLGLNGGLATTEEPDIGTMGDCENCMPGCPSGNTSQLNSHDLFGGGSRISSSYGERIDPITGVSTVHGAMDVAPFPNTGYGTELLAPSSGRIIGVTSGGITFRPAGFPNNSSLFFYHVSLSTDLTRPLPIQVQAGNSIGNLANIGRTTGAHVHIQYKVGGNLYNPACVFPR